MITRWNDPFRELESFRNQVNRLFGEALPAGRSRRRGPEPRGLGPAGRHQRDPRPARLPGRAPRLLAGQSQAPRRERRPDARGRADVREGAREEGLSPRRAGLRALRARVLAPGERRPREDQRLPRRRRPDDRAPEARGGQAEVDPDRDRHGEADLHLGEVRPLTPGSKARVRKPGIPSSRPAAGLRVRRRSRSYARRGPTAGQRGARRDPGAREPGSRAQPTSPCRTSRGREGCPTAAPARARPASAPLRGPPGRARTPRFARCTRALA